MHTRGSVSIQEREIPAAETEKRWRCYKGMAIPIMPKYKLAIFDLDGTLSDSLPWFLRVEIRSPTSIASGVLKLMTWSCFAANHPAKSSGISRCRCGEYLLSRRICAG